MEGKTQGLLSRQRKVHWSGKPRACGMSSQGTEGALVWMRWREKVPVLASSFSENFPNTLNCAEVKIYSQNKCERAYPGKITEGMVCAGSSNGADTCQVSNL